MAHIWVCTLAIDLAGAFDQCLTLFVISKANCYDGAWRWSREATGSVFWCWAYWPTGGNGGGGPGGGDEKKNKVKPMSKKISTALSQTSSKMTEILAWQAKLQENKAGLLLAKVYWSRHIYIYIFPHLCIDHETYNVCVCVCVVVFFSNIQKWPAWTKKPKT